MRWTKRRELGLPNADLDDEDPDNPPPKRPGGIDKNIWLDISPMRPDELGKQRSMPWTQAAADQIAYHSAIADVNAEADGFQKLAGMGPPVA